MKKETLSLNKNHPWVKSALGDSNFVNFLKKKFDYELCSLYENNSINTKLLAYGDGSKKFHIALIDYRRECVNV